MDINDLRQLIPGGVNEACNSAWIVESTDILYPRRPNFILVKMRYSVSSFKCLSRKPVSEIFVLLSVEYNHQEIVGNIELI